MFFFGIQLRKMSRSSQKATISSSLPLFPSLSIPHILFYIRILSQISHTLKINLWFSSCGIPYADNNIQVHSNHKVCVRKLFVSYLDEQFLSISDIVCWAECFTKCMWNIDYMVSTMGKNKKCFFNKTSALFWALL